MRIIDNLMPLVYFQFDFLHNNECTSVPEGELEHQGCFRQHVVEDQKLRSHQNIQSRPLKV